MKKVYLAGPSVFYHNWKEHSEELKSLCYKLGFEPLYPMDNEVSGESPEDIAKNIAKANVAMIQEADAIIADITEFHGTSMDVGTAFEVGMAIQRGIPVVTYTEGARENYKERIAKKEEIRELDNGDVVDSKGMTVENFGLQENLMISALSDYSNEGPEGALKILKKIFN
jgi:nucleoside 2-deoxyribosyltransferase